MDPALITLAVTNVVSLGGLAALWWKTSAESSSTLSESEARYRKDLMSRLELLEKREAERIPLIEENAMLRAQIESMADAATQWMEERRKLRNERQAYQQEREQTLIEREQWQAEKERMQAEIDQLRCEVNTLKAERERGAEG